tara:strand:+ start:143 stop:664 length:522 start_codon:yes stop_codon:yes gene_type:complete
MEVEVRGEVHRNRQEQGRHLELEEGLRHFRLVHQQAVKAEAKLDRVKGKEVAELAKHQKMPGRHPKNQAGEIQEGCQREKEVLQVGNPALPEVPREQANPKVLRGVDQCFRELNHYLKEESQAGYCQAVAAEVVREEVLNQVAEAPAGFRRRGSTEEANPDRKSVRRKESQDR